MERLPGFDELETPEQVIERFELAPLPGEGGYFRETYRSADRIPASALPARYAGSGDRAAATSIYYLITRDTYSALHRLRSDEVYHFYAGAPVEMTLLDESGGLKSVILGPRPEAVQCRQRTVSAGVWQGLRVEGNGEWSLMGTTVAPGFEFSDRTMAGEDLIARFPQHAVALEPLMPHIDR